MAINKWSVIYLILLGVFLFLAGILYASSIIPLEAFYFISALVLFIPLAGILIPILMKKWFEKGVPKMDVYDCWKEVKKRIKNDTTRTLVNIDETYIPHRQAVFKSIWVYICEIKTSDLRQEGTDIILRGEDRFIVFDIQSKKILWEEDANILNYQKFVEKYDYYSRFFIEGGTRQQILIPERVTETQLGGTALSRA